ncbi:hypothetical protein Asi03nite_12160 [Actinoplanes siamensis]|uniref:Uncharacterized protein n=1 Tax=Actinoplanes siamensis TaxID=1223317 RepID=A0A919N3G3_9ACTN|nr:hypothetical protein Asi03nite_12160 [Actinoplanes siamensis]
MLLWLGHATPSGCGHGGTAPGPTAIVPVHHTMRARVSEVNRPGRALPLRVTPPTESRQTQTAKRAGPRRQAREGIGETGQTHAVKATDGLRQINGPAR